ncbi:hypothetical protein L195_g059115, partial [Trifolium pratense]
EDMSQQEVPETQLEHVDPDVNWPEVVKKAWATMAKGDKPLCRNNKRRKINAYQERLTRNS